MSNQGKLNNIGKEQPFRVPENYFRDLPEQIMDKCKQDEQKRSIVHILKPALSLAAMFVGVALIAYFALQMIDRPAVQVPSNQQDIAEAEYFDRYFNQNELLEGDPENEEEPKTDNKKTQKYIKYLLDEDIDYTTLINELEEDQGQQKGEKQ